MTSVRPAPKTAAPAPADGWDTDLFVLRGDDRGHLRDRVLALLAFLDRHPETRPADLAATLAADLPAGGTRLAVIASSLADLVKKLTRAADRLADPNCKQLRDAAGVYFTDAPLFAQGSLALLFPGEGAQYLDMLADLCGPFPEVGATFAEADRIAAEAGRPEASLRPILHPPAGATAAERAAAEAKLREIGPSLIGVLLADLAVARMLDSLKLPVAAVAGHSAGELGALVAAGAIRAADDVVGPHLMETMEVMDRQDGGAGADVALIAAGAGKATVTEIAAAVAGGGLVVAMDNCPHQCVAVGPTHLVAAVESALVEKGILCERLPFSRPYHTPLFEPWMGPFREMFSRIEFGPAHTPVYSGTTAARFPADPAACRRLCVEHWVNPVEFTRTVEAMYADGVRIFVEAGPRGNLSAFTEDILRGRPFAAIPANVPRKSGPTQVNHMVGQLVAHGVPVEVGHLFARRNTRVVAWECRDERGSDLRAEGLVPSVPHAATKTEGTSPSARNGVAPHDPVMDGYLAVMEQYLDVQRHVMEAFFAGHADPSAFPADFAWTADTTLAPAEPQSASQQLALVGTVAHHTPWQDIVVRRTLSLAEDLYVDHHTLGGREVSRCDPGQNGLPILPMTFSLEAMAEAAALLCPGKVVTAVKNVRLHRWVPYDAEPTTLEVRAAVKSFDEATGGVEVSANVRDLGNSFLRDAADKIASEATVVLADRYPDPPAAHPFPLTDEAPCKASVEQLCRNMFHGPLFQMIRSLDRFGKEGIEGTLEVQSRDTWFRSVPDPATLLDPVLTDAAMHLIGAWHLEQPDWSGRILLPVGLQKIEYFGPPPAAGTKMLVRGHNEEESARHTKHGLEIFQPDGRLWLRLTGGGYWRFYLPFMHVNFFGPKDEYYLTRDLPEAAVPTAGPRPRCQFIDPPPDLKQAVLRASGVKVSMTPREQAEFFALDEPDAEKDVWFFGRLTAKDACRAAWAEKHPTKLFPADIESEMVDGRVVCRFRGEPGPEPLPPVALAVAGGKIAAFSAFAKRVGVALVPVPKKATAADDAKLRGDAARRAVADALRSGDSELTVESVDPASGAVRIGLGAGAAGRYPDLVGPVWVQTARQRDAIVATTLCEAEQDDRPRPGPVLR